MNRKTIYGVIAVLIAFSCISGYIGGNLVGSIEGYNTGVAEGTQQTLTGVSEMLKQQGIDIAWSHNADGSYTVQCLNGDGTTSFSTNVVFHAYADQYRDGKLLASSYHTMSITNYGKDWVEQQLFAANATQKAIYLSTSANTTSFSAAWTMLPDEITANGLSRATGVYSSTGVGTANVTATYSVTDTQSTQLYGINSDTYASNANSLIAAEQQGAGAVKNFLNGDTLVLTVQWSHS